MGKEQFIGAWRLAAFESRTSDGESLYPFGQDPIGIITYSASGHMSVHIMRTDRPQFKSGERAAATLDEIKAAFDGYVAYWGTYEVNDAEGFVVHRVEGSLYPNMVGTDQKRFFEFSGNRLILKPPPTRTSSGERTSRVVWERLPE